MEKYIRDILNYSTDIQYYFDVQNLRYSYVSPSIKEHFNVDPDELINSDYRFILDLVHPEDRDSFENYWKQIFSAENKNIQTSSCDYRCRSKSTKFLWYSDSHRFVRNKNLEIIAVIGSIRDITDLKVVEILKSTSKERLSLAMEAASDSIWEWKVPSNKLFLDARFYAILGYEPYEFPDTILEWENHIHLDDRKQVIHALNLCAKGETNEIHAEYRVLTKNKDWKWILCRAKVSNKNPEGKTTKILGTQTDITNLKKAEAEVRHHNEALKEAEKVIKQNSQALQILYNNLKESEERLKLFFDEAKNIAFLMLEPKFNSLIITEFSPGGELIFGLNRQQVIQNSLESIFRKDFNLIFKQLISSLNKSKKDYKGEISLQNSNGENITALISVHFIQKEDSENYAILAIISDITERKQFEIALRYKNDELVAAEEELKATNDELKFVNEEVQLRNIDLRKLNDKLVDSEEKFRELAENTNDAYWLRNEHQMLYINPSFEKVWGRSKEEIFNSPQLLEKWVHPEDRTRFNKWVDFSTFTNIKTYSEQYRIIKSDGSIRWLWSRIHPVYNNEGHIYRVAGIATDITEQKETEEALIRAKEKAFESDRLKSAFLANISHEIRTPMNGILGFVELLNDSELNPDTRSQYVNIISKSSKQLLQIIDDIIDISKIEANQVKIDLKECNINSTIKDILLFYQKDKLIQEKKNLDLKYQIILDEDHAKIYTDESRLRQIIMNLFDNAVKFTLAGEILIGYKLIDNKSIEFFVKDTGIGIPIDQQKTVFERFRQVDDSATRKFGGTGLGLSISEGLVKLLGGTIWFESMPNQGTTFYFSLPYHPVNRRIITSEIDVDIHDPQWEDKIIMVVEDDEINFEFLKTILEPSNAVILYASSGEDALRIFSSNNNIDLVLMDIRLPGISGYEAMRMIKNQKPSIPVIAQTAFAMAEDYSKCLEQGFDDYISKPINRRHLLKIIHKQFQYH
jgi:PAS domain S-box-containing protein